MNNSYFSDKSIFTSFSPKVVNFVYAHPILFQIYLPLLRSNCKGGNATDCLADFLAGEFLWMLRDMAYH
jgi:hypothetical protein